MITINEDTASDCTHLWEVWAWNVADRADVRGQIHIQAQCARCGTVSEGRAPLGARVGSVLPGVGGLSDSGGVDTVSMTVTDWESAAPFIAWREPAPVRLIGDDQEHYACRICIATCGLQGRDIPHLPTDPDEVRRHIARAHLLREREDDCIAQERP